MLFVSGYAGQTILDHQVMDVENNFLQKPYTLRQLANKVRDVLDRTNDQPNDQAKDQTADRRPEEPGKPPMKALAPL
jgi:DNA-binding response OmpR family regulator